MNDIQSIKEYYDSGVLGKLKAFVYGNDRVERAWEELNNWLIKTPLKILEIGCGIGDLSWRISKKYPNANVLGFDVSEYSIEIANKLYSSNKLSFIQADDISLLEQSSFNYDLIFLVDVFEHIPVQSRVNLFNFIKNNLNQDGIVFISCPTISHQNWLKQNKSVGLQPIDEDITIKEIIEFSSEINRSLLLFREICVWNAGDYFHAVLGQRKYQPFSDRTKVPQLSIKKILMGRFLNQQNKANEEELKNKLNLIKKKLGTEIYNLLSGGVV